VRQEFRDVERNRPWQPLSYCNVNERIKDFLWLKCAFLMVWTNSSDELDADPEEFAKKPKSS
jgi:hypothetical protein